MTREELLEEAERRYPKGTRFDNYNIISYTGSRDKISDGKPYWDGPVIGICRSSGNMTIYKNGEWATILTQNIDNYEIY